MQIYVVQPGDTIFEIAQRFGTTVEAIADANRYPRPRPHLPGPAAADPSELGTRLFVQDRDRDEAKLP